MATRFGLDIDGVLYKWENTVRYLIEKQFGIRIKLPAEHWDAIQEQLTKEQWKWLWTDGVRAGMFRHGHVYKGAIDGVQSLARLGDVYLITSRPAAAREDTLAWVGYHELPVCGVTVLSVGERKSDFPMDVFIDDGPTNIQDIIDNTDAFAIMWNRQWNEGFTPIKTRDPMMFRRVDNWGQLLGEFE